MIRVIRVQKSFKKLLNDSISLSLIAFIDGYFRII